MAYATGKSEELNLTLPWRINAFLKDIRPSQRLIRGSWWLIVLWYGLIFLGGWWIGVCAPYIPMILPPFTWIAQVADLWIWSNYSDLIRPKTPNGAWVREIPLFQGNLIWYYCISFGQINVFLVNLIWSCKESSNTTSYHMTKGACSLNFQLPWHLGLRGQISLEGPLKIVGSTGVGENPTCWEKKNHSQVKEGSTRFETRVNYIIAGPYEGNQWLLSLWN